MPDYQNGKIYKVKNMTTGCVYYGSTTMSLPTRFILHKNQSKRHNSPLYKAMRSKKYMWGIILVEDYPCNSRRELEEREGYYIKKALKRGGSLYNKNIAGVDARGDTKKYYSDYRERNLSKIRAYYRRYQLENEKEYKEYQKAYRNDPEHKEKMKAYQKAYREKNKLLKSQ